MSFGYRVCVLVLPDEERTAIGMTRPEHAHLSDEALVQEALAEARRSGLLAEAVAACGVDPQLVETQLRCFLEIRNPDNKE